MIMFWMTAALMLVLAYLFFVPALLGKSRNGGVSRSRLNLRTASATATGIGTGSGQYPRI